MNSFLQQATNISGSNLSRTENGALTFNTTGSTLVDQFGTAGSFRGRKLFDVFGDQKTLDQINRRDAVKFIFYLRGITRNYEDLGLNKGQGARDEAFKRLLFYVYQDSSVFYNNLGLMTYVGSFRDIWDIIVLAQENNIALDYNRIYALYELALNSKHRDLALKYLPSIVAKSKVKTSRAAIRNRVAKNFAKYLGLTPKNYRLLKTEGQAHDWQKAISVGEFLAVDFNRVPGRALSQLVGSKFLRNQGLETSYDNWLQSQPIAKFTGYAYELGDKISSANKPYQIMTINKQFDGLIKLVQDTGEELENVWTVVDTSGSMNASTAGGATTAINVAKSLAIYFSSLNTGAFKDQVVMFSRTSKLLQLKGNFTDKYRQFPGGAMGNTNFQSVIELLAKTRKKNPMIPLEDYPTTLLVVSDLQFDPTETRYDAYYGSVRGNLTLRNIQTNHEAMMSKLKGLFPNSYINKLKIVWWNVTDRVSDTFHSTIQDGGTYYVSGFDGSVISTILGGEEVIDDRTGQVRQPTAEERVQAALSQPVYELVQA